MATEIKEYLSNFAFKIPDQKFRIEVSNLRASTRHYLLMDGQDWSNRCKVDGYNLGDPLITSSTGRISLDFYWSNQNEGALSLNSTLSTIFKNNQIGDKTWCLTDITGTSQAHKTLFANATKPDVFVDLVNTTNDTSGTISYGDAGLPSLLSGGTIPIAQSVYIDPNIVNGATQIYLTSVDLFNKYKPKATGNQSGIDYPGVSVYIVPTSDNVPKFGLISNYPMARREYLEILPSLEGDAPTKFRFNTPVLIKTGVYYAFVIVCDGNESYTFWSEKIGETNAVDGSIVTSLGNKFSGSYYELTSYTSTWQPVSAKALKFNLSAARFATNGVPLDANSSIYDMHICDPEFIDYDIIGSTGRLFGGEMVYQPSGPADGTGVAVQGSFQFSSPATNFTGWFTSNTEPNYIVVTDYIHTNIRQIVGANGTIASLNYPLSFSNSAAKFYFNSPVATAYSSYSTVVNNGSKNRIILTRSSANSSIQFANGKPIIGEVSGAYLANAYTKNILISDVDPQIHVDTPPGTSFTIDNILSYNSTSNGLTATLGPTSFPVTMYTDNRIMGKQKALMSRSNEVSLYTPALAADPANSSIISIKTFSRNDFIAATVDGRKSDVFFTTYYINNDYTNENTKYGNAISKAISNKITLAPGVYAEDIMIYASAYCPPGTHVKMFAKIHHSNDLEAFDDKDWTLLTKIGNANTHSSLSNTNDYVLYTYSFGNYPNTISTLSKSVTATDNSANLISTTASFGSVNVGDLVKLYSPLFANTNHMVASVVSVTNTTLLTLDQPVANSGVEGSGLYLDKLVYPYQAFSNIMNANTVRYYSSSGSYFDDFDTFSIKTVMLSNNMSVVPNLSSIQAVAVSA